MKTIRMVDLRGQYTKIKAEIDQAIQKVLDDTAFIQGPEVTTFSKSLAEYLGGIHVVTCANGTDALQIAMMALDVAPGDEIILPVHTYVATAEVVALLKLKLVFVDVDPATFNMDVNQVEGKITSKTKAIVPVHLFGQCAHLEPLLQLAKKYNIPVIEDFAQSLGAVYTFTDGSKKKSGTMGTMGCTSFFPSKNLGCFGDGGAITSPFGEIAAKAKMIANHGQRSKYYHDVVGVNSRLDTLQAGVLDIKLKYLDQFEDARRKTADFYDRELAGVDFIETPFRSPYTTHVFHQYTLKTKNIDRDHFKKYLEEKEIPSIVYYPVPLHMQKAYAQPGVGISSFPVTEALSKTVLSLPIHTEMEEDQLYYICDNIKSYRGK